jgi:hypothetical protein
MTELLASDRAYDEPEGETTILSMAAVRWGRC